MVTVNEICQFLEELAPLRLAETWDNVGLLVGRADREVRRVMTCLTLTMSVAQEAIDQKTQMIVTHHPILFRATKKITDSSEEGRLLLSLAEAGIAVYSPHTAFDSAATGINQRIAESLNLTEIKPLRILDNQQEVGAGRFGMISTPCDRDQLLEDVAAITKAEYLEYSWQGTAKAHRIAIACGSAADFLQDAARMGCDTFITGEARFHSVLESRSQNLNLILTGHFCSERPAIEQLAEEVSRRFLSLVCTSSKNDTNPLSIHFGRRS